MAQNWNWPTSWSGTGRCSPCRVVDTTPRRRCLQRGPARRWPVASPLEEVNRWPPPRCPQNWGGRGVGEPSPTEEPRAQLPPQADLSRPRRGNSRGDGKVRRHQSRRGRSNLGRDEDLDNGDQVDAESGRGCDDPADCVGDAVLDACGRRSGPALLTAAQPSPAAGRGLERISPRRLVDGRQPQPPAGPGPAAAARLPAHQPLEPLARFLCRSSGTASESGLELVGAGRSGRRPAPGPGPMTGSSPGWCVPDPPAGYL